MNISTFNSQPSLSRKPKHVAILRRAGIVIYERKGKDIYYSIDPNKIKDVANAIKLLNGNNIDT